MTNKKVLHIFSASIFAVLLIALIIPFGESGRIVAAILLLPAAVLTFFYIKKRPILSINKDQILLIVTVIALVFVMVYYLSGIPFGFYKNPYRLSFTNFFKFFLPIATIIVATEAIRYVIVAQNDKVADILCYLSCVVAETLVCSNIPSVTSFNRFMDLVAGALFPAIVSNLLYHYLSKRYGLYPNLVYRLLTTLHSYVFAISSGVSQSLINLIRLFLPIVIYIFIDALYEKKVRYALEKKSKLAIPITVIAVAIMIFVILVVSNQFFIGSYVIATESMTGELNKGDAAIYERYEDQTIEEGQVIVFEHGGRVVVHRAVDIQIINGQTRYFTKGDANEDIDAGFIYDSNIIGLVKFKIPIIGYPTLWLRSLFSR